MSKRISDAIRECNKPFKWGTNDCCTLFAKAVEATSGRDILRGYRGYKTKKGAAKKLRDKGHGTLVKFVKSCMGDEIHIAQARHGDIVMQDARRVGVCCGRWTAMLGDDGIAYVRTLDCQLAFQNRE